MNAEDIARTNEELERLKLVNNYRAADYAHTIMLALIERDANGVEVDAATVEQLKQIETRITEGR